MASLLSREADARPWLRSYPKGVPAHLEVPDQLVQDFLEEAIRRWPDRAALIYYGRRWSYRELGGAVDRFAAALLREGVRPGDRVGIMLPNCPAYPVAFFAALKCGATVVQVNPLWVGDDLEAVLADARPRCLVTLESLYPNLSYGVGTRAVPVVFVARLAEFYRWHLRPFVRWVQRRRGLVTGMPREARVRPWKSALRTAPASLPPRGDPRKSVAVLQYTGGTTGLPKGAMLTHRNLVANVLQTDVWNTTRQPGEEVFVASIPFFHAYGLMVAFLLAIAEGGTIVLQIRPEPRELLRLIDRHRPTQLPAVPALYTALLAQPDVARFRLDSIRYCVSGSAPLPLEVQRRFSEVTGGFLLEGYGLTEASPVTHANPTEGQRRPGSIGIPLPETEQRVVSLEDGRPLPTPEVGELEVRGPQVMLGYYHQPGDSAAVLHDGWLRTGDLARIEADGFAFVVGRLKDMIDVGGLKVYPTEVEQTLHRCPGVAEVAVVASPDPALGEVPRAYVVRTPGSRLSAEEVIAFARAHLAHYKAPRSVVFRDSLPKSGIQKTLHRVLRDEAFGRSSA